MTYSYTYIVADYFIFSIVFTKNPVLANELAESLLKDFWKRNSAADEICCVREKSSLVYPPSLRFPL